jgi:alpha-ribazole phosphatase
VKLWLVRHGAVDCEEGTCYGATDVPAVASAAREIAGRVAPLLPHRVDVHASPLNRCAQVALALEALRPELQAQFDTRIAEMSFGTWEGRDAAWITHAGVIRAVLLLHQGVRRVERADQWPTRAIGMGEVVLIEAP